MRETGKSRVIGAAGHRLWDHSGRTTGGVTSMNKERCVKKSSE